MIDPRGISPLSLPPLPVSRLRVGYPTSQEAVLASQTQ